jgi:nitroreductase
MSQNLEALKHGPAESGVEEVILKRWSPRSYADKPVSSADLTKIFTAAAWAASSFNEQP